MITAWVVYAVALTALIALAARAVEEMLDAWELPARWVWTAAAAGSVAGPATLRWDLVGQIGRRIEGLLDGGAAGAEVGGSVAAEALAASPPPTAGGWPELLQFPAVADRAVLVLWAAGSAVVLAGALRAWWRVRRRRRDWLSHRISGTDVLVSEETGPAVAGVFEPVIVVPRRILDLPGQERRLVVAHEREHREAGDPALLAVGLAALAACPWNPALWWVVRRLRLAVERDCDRRVIEAGAEPGAYGTVLLAEAGARRAALPAAALGHGRSHLEHRIRALARGAPRFRSLRSAAAAIAGAALLVVACDAPTPSDPAAPRGGPEATSAARGTEADAAASTIVPPGSRTGTALDSLRPEDVESVSVAPRSGTAEVTDEDGRTFRIRGARTLDLQDLPLVLIDGRKTNGTSGLDDLDPDEIETIEVIKGPAAVELYGEEARDGVVRIDTRGGG